MYCSCLSIIILENRNTRTNETIDYTMAGHHKKRFKAELVIFIESPSSSDFSFQSPFIFSFSFYVSSFSIIEKLHIYRSESEISNSRITVRLSIAQLDYSSTFRLSINVLQTVIKTIEMAYSP